MMGKIALLVGACSLAQPVALGTQNAELPPVRFRGNTAAIVVFTDREGIDRICGKSEPPAITVACMRRTQTGTPFIFMPNACGMGQIEYYAKVMCHEAGHVQGWGENHEE